MTKPLIRPAQPQDAQFIAWATQAANRSHVEKGWFDIALDRPESDCLEFIRRLALTEVRSWWHYSLFLIAEVEGHAAAALCRFRAGDAFPLSVPAMTEVVRSYGWGDAELEAIWRRGMFAFTCIMPGGDDRWTIENVATRPEYRGQGLVDILIDRALEDGRLRGLRQAQISFLIGNVPAERAYARAGFRFADEKRHPDFEAACGSPGMRRFTRDL